MQKLMYFISLVHSFFFLFSPQRPTVCITDSGAGVDSAWKQKKFEARKMLENAADSHASDSCFVGRVA
jgi:hypothetical protein